jgi:tyrosyl-tRNA synthetase
MFGKLMSVPDEAMGTYYELLLGEDEPGGHPAEAKRALARRIVERFDGKEAAQEAEAHFNRLHVEHGLPDEMPELDLSSDPAIHSGDDGEVHLPQLISSAFEISTSEARRLLSQGAVKLDGEALDGERLDLPAAELSGKVLQVGKRRFLRLTGSRGS